MAADGPRAERLEDSDRNGRQWALRTHDDIEVQTGAGFDSGNAPGGARA